MQLGVAFAAACFALDVVYRDVAAEMRGGISVQILPGTTISIDEGQSTSFTASVTNDIHNQGVTWSLVQTTSTVCSGSGCGTLSNATNSSVTYTAPPNLTAGKRLPSLRPLSRSPARPPRPRSAWCLPRFFQLPPFQLARRAERPIPFQMPPMGCHTMRPSASPAASVPLHFR